MIMSTKRAETGIIGHTSYLTIFNSSYLTIVLFIESYLHNTFDPKMTDAKK